MVNRRTIGVISVALLALLAGCAGDNLHPAGPDNTDPVEGGIFSEPPPQNPWEAEAITVSITESASPSRNYAPLVRESLAYWNQNMSTLGWEGQFVYALNATDPDITVHFVDGINDCGDDRDEALGCAPINTRVGDGIDGRPVEIMTRQNDTSTVKIAIHEFGHTLGLTHNDTASWPLMDATIASSTIPQPDAVTRANPFETDTLYVYYNGTSTDSPSEYEIGELQSAWDYFNEGHSQIVPETVRFVRTRKESQADIEIRFVESLEGGVSTIQFYGFDPDADGQLETYDTATIYIDETVNQGHVAWHTGGWITYLFSSQEEGALPDELTSRSPDVRQSWP